MSNTSPLGFGIHHAELQKKSSLNADSQLGKISTFLAFHFLDKVLAGCK